MAESQNRVNVPTQQQLIDQIVSLDLQMRQQAEQINKQNNVIVSLQQEILKSKSNNESSVSMKQISTSEKLPALEKFKGNRAMWDEWQLGAVHKLEKDGEVIGNEFDQFMYIYSRLDGEAVKMVTTTAKMLSDSKTGKGREFLNYLNTVFGDPNKKARAQQQLYSLKQNERESFANFLPKFETILATAGWSAYADDQKISLLKNALSKEMRTALIGRKLPLVWMECISDLLTISSEILAINLQFRPTMMSQQPPFKSQNFTESPKMDWEPIKSTVTGTQESSGKRATWVKKETLDFRKKRGLCVRCGNKGHISTRCSLLPPLNPIIKTNSTRLSAEEEMEILNLAKPDVVGEDDEGKAELL